MKNLPFAIALLGLILSVAVMSCTKLESATPTITYTLPDVAPVVNAPVGPVKEGANGITAFTVNLEQLSAMVKIYQANPKSARYFRIYITEGDRGMNVVRGITEENQRLKTPVFCVSDAGSGPCPIVCD